MNQETKDKINRKYERELEDGERFWPDSIFKDVIVSLGLFTLLILLATFVGVHDSPKADPSDTSYIPRPEWYFLFLFKFLALYGQIPVLGKIEWIATVLVPGIAVGLLTFLPFVDKSPDRYYGKRILPIGIMVIMVTSMVTLTLMADIPTVLAEGPTLATLLQPVAGLVVPGLGLTALVLMSFVFRQTSTRVMIAATVLTSGLMVVLTAVILLAAPPAHAETVELPKTLADKIVAGQDLYSLHCTECHGDDGSVTVIEGVEGLDGTVISPISSRDVLYTVNDASMAEIISYGRPESGMNPFGKAYNPEGLTRAEIDYIILFMRYTWDDRFEAPVIQPLYPPLAEGEVPSYDVHIAPIVKRYCISCHRDGKENNNYWMTSYDEIINMGDNAPLVEAGNLESILLQTIQETPIYDENGNEIIGVMPPNKPLKAEIVGIFKMWVQYGMPQTAEEAAALSQPPASPEAGSP